MADRQTDLYFELSRQAFKEELPEIGTGFYNAAPNSFGRAMDRFMELCQENGLCPKCGMPVEECDCEDAND